MSDVKPLTSKETIAALTQMLDEQCVPQPIYLDVLVGQEIDPNRVLLKRIESLIFGWKFIANQRDTAERRLQVVREALDNKNPDNSQDA